MSISQDSGSGGRGSKSRAFTWRGGGSVELHGESFGDPKHQLVVLLHGGGQTRHAWKNLGGSLASVGFHALALDARGHGDSDWATDGAYGTEAQIEDVMSLLVKLGDTHPVLVGASMGGTTSLVAVGRGQIDARALVLIDIAPQLERDGVDRITTFMLATEAGFSSLEEVAEAVAAYQPQRPRPESFEGLSKNVRMGSDGRYRWHWDPRFLSQQTPMDPEWKQELEGYAERLTLPTLLVRGAMSDVLTESGARKFLELCPAAEYANVSGAGHMVAGDRNDAFSDTVRSFLRRVVTPVPDTD
jgi:pimeloyl-ACP methyl ester carboxylesterase